MNKYLKLVEKRARELQVESSRQCAKTIENARAYHEGYEKGVMDIVNAMEDIAEDETLYKE